MVKKYMQCTYEIASTIRQIKAASKSSILGRCALASFGYWWQDHPEFHTLLSCESRDKNLFLRFDNDVSLTVKTPKDAEHYDGSFIVWGVESLTWKWKGYRDHYSPTNYFYRNYWSGNGNMYCGSNEGTNPLQYTPRVYHPALVLAWDLPSGPPGLFLSRIRDLGKVRFEFQQLEGQKQIDGLSFSS